MNSLSVEQSAEKMWKNMYFQGSEELKINGC